MRRLLIFMTIISILAGSGALTDAAAAKIVPGRSIAGIKVGYSIKRVRDALGRPHKVAPPAWLYGKPLDGGIGFNFRRRVNDIWTTARHQKTVRGIGPGSTVRATKRAYPRAGCYTHRRRRTQLCILTSHYRGRTIKTDFLFSGWLREVNIDVVPSSSGTPVHK
jgi:hypothetical protein